MAVQAICINTTSQCGSGSPLPPCVGNCGGGSGGDCECWVPWDIENGYSVGDVVIYNDQLYIANGDIPPGTPFTIGTTGATWRAISVGTTTIVPFDPTRSYSQWEAVSYDGKLYVANTALLPGPFNPVDWTEISSDGVISTSNTNAIQLTGNGTALDPLIATLLLDGLAGDNLLQITPAGLYLNPADIPGSETVVNLNYGVTWWVDTVTGDDLDGDGRMTSPYKTVTRAMITAGEGDLILVMPGTYPGEDLIWKSNVLVQGYGAQDSALTVLEGQFSVGTGITRARAKDIGLRGTVAGLPTLIFEGSAGRAVFDNVSISHADANTFETVRFTGNNTNWYVFRDGGISHNVTIDDPAQANAMTLYIEGGAEKTGVSVSADNASVYISDRVETGIINHNAGTLVLRDIKTIMQLNSAANVPGLLVVQASSAIENNQFTNVFSKTGDAPFWFNGFARNPNYDGTPLPGTQILVELAQDINGQIEPENYVATTPALTDHLKGIDTKLGDIALGKTVNVDFAVDFGDQWVAGGIAISHVLREETSFPVADSTNVLFGSSDPIDGVIRVVVDPADGSPNYDLIVAEVDAGTLVTITGAAATLQAGDVILFITDNSATFTYATLTITGERVVSYVP